MKLVFENKRSKKRMNEEYVTDYIDSEKLSKIMEREEFGEFSHYRQHPNMTIETVSSGPMGWTRTSRFWKFIKNDDGSWEVNEVDENNNLVEPRVNFVLSESKKRVNEDLSSLNGEYKDLYDAVSLYLDSFDDETFMKYFYDMGGFVNVEKIKGFLHYTIDKIVDSMYND